MTGGGEHDTLVMALYRPHAGKDAALRALIAEHLPALRRLELVTDRPPLLLRAANGTYVEIFEWMSADAARAAHRHPDVARIWDTMGGVADFVSLDSLEESHRPFTHFTPVVLRA
jgi:hypothetical protein